MAMKMNNMKTCSICGIKSSICYQLRYKFVCYVLMNMMFLTYLSISTLVYAFLLQGYLETHPRLYDVVIKLFEKKNIQFTKTLAELWKNKRLSHALCASPVNHIFIETFSKHESQLCISSMFWRKCMEELKPLVVGFHHINHEIEQAAFDLISNVSSSSKLMSICFTYIRVKKIIVCFCLL